ncbi:unnamed protein product [Prorocentrum cordatum]|uniref:RanBP2-type domain-containing protein n=1 Tax=Prorocentrum cordatum TaxID=2364126 RepID=A0ABN9V6T5_9DINO|nr:unnamed protein product [Polarella glacialis]
MADYWKCSCGEFNTKGRRTCGGCGALKPQPRDPWSYGGPKAAEFWVGQPRWTSTKQKGVLPRKPWVNMSGGGGDSGQQAPAGATLSASEIREWPELPFEAYKKTKCALCRSSRSKIENARRAAAAGLLSAAGCEALRAVDKAARARQQAKERLANNNGKALKMLEAVSASEAEVAKLEKELEARRARKLARRALPHSRATHRRCAHYRVSRTTMRVATA